MSRQLLEFFTRQKNKFARGIPEQKPCEDKRCQICRNKKKTRRRDVFKVVDHKVKVVQKQEGKQLVYKNDNARRKSDSCIADTTTSIRLALWEDLIDHVHAAK